MQMVGGVFLQLARRTASGKVELRLGAGEVEEFAAMHQRRARRAHVNLERAIVVKPLDRELILEKAQSIGNVVTIEEGVRIGGFGSAVLELISDEGLNGIQTTRLGVPDTFVEHGSRRELLNDLGLTAEGIANSTLNFLQAGSTSKLRRISR